MACARSPPPPTPEGVVEAECLDPVLDGDDSGSSRTAILFETMAAVCAA
jgi:hypothetical protein